jgi:hypothetical protein
VKQSMVKQSMVKQSPVKQNTVKENRHMHSASHMFYAGRSDSVPTPRSLEANRLSITHAVQLRNRSLEPRADTDRVQTRRAPSSKWTRVRTTCPDAPEG